MEQSTENSLHLSLNLLKNPTKLETCAVSLKFHDTIKNTEKAESRAQKKKLSFRNNYFCTNTKNF
jgi:hypothetical protein